MQRALMVALSLAFLALLPAAARPSVAPTPSALVGAYYFDGWSGPLSNSHFDGLVRPGSNGQFQGLRPLSGWRDNSPDAMQAQLRWAHADGISFFVFDWYRQDIDPLLNVAHDNYLKLPDHHGVGYALLYVNHDPFGFSPAEWPAAVNNWITEDFSNPDYMRIDGKPLLVIYDTTLFRQQMGGSSGVNQAIDTLQQAAKQHGLPGIFVVGDRGTDYGNSQCFPVCDATDGGPNGLVTEHYDALSAYNYPLVIPPTRGARPYNDVVAGEEQAWSTIAQKSPFPYIPSVMTGWDPRPWDEEFFGTTLEWFTRTPVGVGGFLSDAIAWVGAHPSMQVEPTPTPPVVLVEAWNELGEGATVLPTADDGYSYGQAIASAVGVPWNAPPRYLVTVATGQHGVVHSNPPGLSCPRRCRFHFDEGQQVTLTAIPKHGFAFSRWSKGCAGRRRTCGVILLSDSAFRANFRRR